MRQTGIWTGAWQRNQPIDKAIDRAVESARDLHARCWPVSALATLLSHRQPRRSAVSLVGYVLLCNSPDCLLSSTTARRCTCTAARPSSCALSLRSTATSLLTVDLLSTTLF
ncbi:hypothetical protein VTN96DRAFT_2609 [Rasamsonia emersonii]